MARVTGNIILGQEIKVKRSLGHAKLR